MPGTLKLNGVAVSTNAEISVADIAAGRLVFTPDANASGVPYASFKFKVNDATAYSTADYTMTVSVDDVNHVPVSSDATVTTNEDTVYTFKLEDFNFQDSDGDALSKIQIVQLQTAGTLKLNGADITDSGAEVTASDILAGRLTFTPKTDANGDNYSNFRFKVHDGAVYSDSDYTMTVNVTPVNDLPTSSDNVVKTEENQTYTFKIDDFGFEDVDQGDTLAKIQITQSVTSGTLKLNGVAVSTNTDISVADILAGRLTFTPDTNASGTPYASFKFKVNDATGYSTNAYTMSVNVSSVNDLPTASDGTVTTVEDTEYVFKTEDFNFHDTDNDPLSKIQIVQLETAGTLKLNGVDITVSEAEITAADIKAGKLTFSPEADANGDNYSNFRFKVHDGTGYSNDNYTMTVDVTPVNDAPTSENNAVKTEENKTYTFKTEDFKFGDVDKDDSLVTVLITQLPQTGALQLNGVNVTANTEIKVADILSGKLTFRPDTNQSGEPYTAFQFKVNDGETNSVSSYTMTVNVTEVNDLPTASDNTVTTNEDSVYTFKAEDFKFYDADGDSLTKIQIIQLETAGKLQLNGADISLAGTEITIADIQAGKLTFVPALDAYGDDYANFRFKVNDGTGYSTDAYMLTVDVNPVNDLPTSADNIVTTNQNSGETEVFYTFKLSDFVFNDVDAGDSLEKVQITIPSGMKGELRLNGVEITSAVEVSASDIESGKLTFTPEKDTSGDGYANFQFKVNDKKEYSKDAYNMTINVTEGNIPPKALDSSITVDEDVTTNGATGYVFKLSDFGFEDSDGGTLAEIEITQLETAGTLKLNGNDVGLKAVISAKDIQDGKLRFVPNPDANGTAYSNFKFKVKDDGGDKGGTYSELSAVMTVNVTPVQDAPDTSDNPISMMGVVPGETGYAFKVEDFIFNDVDTNDTLTTIQITGLVSAGTLTWNGVNVKIGDVIPVADIIAGKLVFTPVLYEYGDNYDDFQFKVSDGKDYSKDPATMTINVIRRPISPEGPANPVIVDEDTTYTFSLDDFEFDPNADVDITETLKIQITKTPTSGTVKLNGVDIQKFQEISISDIIAGKLTFTPNQDTNDEKSGEESPFEFKFRIFDKEEQKYSIDEYTMAVNVIPVNDQPFSEDGEVWTERNTPYTFKPEQFKFDNDVDAKVAYDENNVLIESATFEGIKIVGLVDKGTLTLHGEEVVIGQVIPVDEIGNLVFTPETDKYGEKEAGYKYTQYLFQVWDGLDESNEGFSDTHVMEIFVPGNERPVINLDPDNIVNGKPGIGPVLKLYIWKGAILFILLILTLK